MYIPREHNHCHRPIVNAFVVRPADVHRQWDFVDSSGEIFGIGTMTMTVSMECFAFAMLSDNWVNVRWMGVMNWKMVDKKWFDVGNAEPMYGSALVVESTATMMLSMMEELRDAILMETAFGGDKTLAMIALRACNEQNAKRIWLKIDAELFIGRMVHVYET